MSCESRIARAEPRPRPLESLDPAPGEPAAKRVVSVIGDGLLEADRRGPTGGKVHRTSQDHSVDDEYGGIECCVGVAVDRAKLIDQRPLEICHRVESSL